MSIFKRILAGILSLAMVFTMLPARASAQETQVEAESSDIKLEASSAFGELLSEEITESQESASETESQYPGGYTVTDLTIEGDLATVVYESLEDALLVVAIYSEDGLQMLASGHAEVSSAEELAYVTIEGDIPEYFLASAYLVDTYDFSPLCAEYDTPMYTQDMQELLASTVEDYDADRILNLDDDEATNFAVYAETTKVIAETEGVNTVSSVDDENATYVITDADESITGLQAGDIFAYPYGEEEILIVKVAAIQVDTDGTTVTITGDEVELEEVFSHVKIEGSANQQDITVTDLDPSDGITYEGAAAAQTYSVAAATSDEGVEVPVKITHSFGINETFTSSDGVSEVTVRGGLALVIDGNFQFYVSDEREYLRFEVETDFGIDFYVSGSVATVFPPLAEIVLPLCPGVSAMLQPTFEIEFSGELDILTSIESTIGFEYESGKDIVSLCTTPKIKKPEIDVEVTFFIGVNLYPSVNILSYYVLSVELEAPVGVLIAVETNGSDSDNILIGSSDVGPRRHDCAACLDITASLTVGLDVNLKLLGKRITEKDDEIRIPLAKLQFYWSITHSEFGSGSCPWLEYRLTVEVRDPEGTLLEGALVTVNGVSAATNKNGIVTFYVPGGYCAVEAAYGDWDKLSVVEITDAGKVVLQLGTTNDSAFIFGVFEGGDIVDDSAGIASGTCGDNATWVLYSTGLMVIQGTGPMSDYVDYDFSQVPDNIPVEITRVSISPGITYIGSHAFYAFSDLKVVSIPYSVTSVGEYAFSNCSSLEYVDIPGPVTAIGTCAFKNCDALKHVNVGGGGTTAVGRNAFSYCENLTGVIFGTGARFLTSTYLKTVPAWKV